MGRFYGEIVWDVKKKRIEKIRDVSHPGSIPSDKIEDGKFYCYMPQNESAYVDFKLFYDKSSLELAVANRYSEQLLM